MKIARKFRNYCFHEAAVYRIINVVDQFPRVFQANADRFYRRVVEVTLNQLPVHSALTMGKAETLTEFLNSCAAQVDNYIANEAIKAFVLTFDGMFERQLRRWSIEHHVREEDWKKLIKKCINIGSHRLAENKIDDVLIEMHDVANVVRHGDGPSCKKLRTHAPHLWGNPPFDCYDLVPGNVPVSDEIRIQSNDLRRYARAIFRFWGHMDTLPDAALDCSY